MGWLTGWNHRKSHVINAAAGAGTEYQVRIHVYYGAGADSGEDVYLNSECETNFGDIRFTSSDGSTELSYYIDSKTDSDNAVFIVKITEDLTSVNRTIYVYYGKTGAATTQSFANTVTELYNFENTDEGWTTEEDMTWADPYDESFDPNNGDAYNGSWSMKLFSGCASANQYLRRAKAFASGRKFYYWVKWSGSLTNYKGGAHWIDAARTQDFADNGSAHAYTLFTFNFTGAPTIRIGQYAKNVFGVYGTSWYYDYWYTFKYVNPEPAHSATWGIEENPPATGGFGDGLSMMA